jgi:uncharacterized protein YbjT (DUF2867 family)
MNKIAIAGATGYLGKHLVYQIIKQKIDGVALARNLEKIAEFEGKNLQKTKAEFTRPETLNGILNGVDTLISTVGITRQKDGLTYMDVDYQANLNLLKEAQRAGIRKFIYVSVLNGEKMRSLKICEAKERFVDELKQSGMEYCVIRPNGFFSDMKDFLTMAKGGKVYLFGDGKLKLNPIHGEDLAKMILETIHEDKKEINVGGPDMLSQNDIAALALKAYSKPVKIIHLPNWIRRCTLWGVRTFTSSKTYGPIEFFMSTMVMDMQAPKYGKHRLEDFFNASVSK